MTLTNLEEKKPVAREVLASTQALIIAAQAQTVSTRAREAGVCHNR